MGLGGISIWQLLIVLLIVVLLFGTKKLKGLGSDLGDAVKGFKKAVTDDEASDKPINQEKTAAGNEDEKTTSNSDSEPRN